MNIINYIQTKYVLLCSVIFLTFSFAQDPMWENDFVVTDYEFDATLSAATITIDGVAQTTGKLAAFVGDEVRGVDSDGSFDMQPFGNFYEMGNELSLIHI